MEQMSVLKTELIKDTTYDIVEYIDQQHAIDVDEFAIMEIINSNLGFLFDVIEEK
jgi:hypothetical protein